jgi:hypothetical protein
MTPGAVLLGATALAAFTLGACGARPRPSISSPPLTPAGLRVFRDPTTGAFVEPPAPAPSAGLPKAAQTAGPTTFVETAAPGGGTMVRLGGAFRSDVTATRGAQGAVVTCGVTAAPR